MCLWICLMCVLGALPVRAKELVSTACQICDSACVCEGGGFLIGTDQCMCVCVDLLYVPVHSSISVGTL